jgi:hypothetical protein
MPADTPFVFFDTDTLITGELMSVPFDFSCPGASLRREGTWPEPTLSALRWLERNFEELICCTCLVAIAVCVFAQVIARYLFQTALHWSEEVASMGMV